MSTLEEKNLRTEIRRDRVAGWNVSDDTIIRVTHVPTGLYAEASAEDHRSQMAAKEAAIAELELRVMELLTRSCCRHPGTGVCVCDCHDRD